jgi:polygalacturonase
MKKVFFYLYVIILMVLFQGFAYFAHGQKATHTLPVIRTTTFRNIDFNIKKYGAKPDGITLNTKSIQSAIDDCTTRGGGKVVVPVGMWLTGPLVLKSNVNLFLEKNALLQFTSDFNQFPLVEGNYEGLPQMRNQPPLSATGQQNIGITGFGIIDGSGDAWRSIKKDKLTESQWNNLVASGGLVSEDKKTWYPSEKTMNGSKLKNPGAISPEKTPAFYQEIKDFLRPNLLVLTNCKQVLLEGVTFQNSPAWCLHPLMCEDLVVRNVYAKNPWNAQNGDGIDLESCRNVLIENSTFDVGDDGICIKSGRDEERRKRGKPCENVIVRNNIVYHAHGGFVIGSEMSGGAKNIYVDNCTFIGTDVGLRFKTTRGRGGIVENIFINNIVMKDIGGAAILFDMYYAAVDPVPLAGDKQSAPKVETLPVSEGTPQFRNFYLKNIICNGAAKALFVRGLPEMNIKNIIMEDMVLQSGVGVNMTEASDITLKNVHLITRKSDPVININNSQNITFDKLSYDTGAKLLINIAGDKSRKILVLQTDLSKTIQKAMFSYGATESALQFK